MGALSLTPVTDLRAHLERHELVSLNVGFDDRLYVLLAEMPTQYRRSTSGGSFARVRPDKPQAFEVLSISAVGEVAANAIDNQPMNYHLVQPLPKGDLLLVCARSHRRGPSDYDLNARVVSRQGDLEAEFVLGDGIEDVQVDEAGTIWASYFDEGVFGNYGWNEPLGAAGLVAWDQQGTRLWGYQPPAGMDQICDCYALNVVSADETWLCYYTEFPLVRLSKRKVIGTWTGLVAGSHAFAVSGEFVLFAGGYDDCNSYYLYKLRSGKSPELVRQFTLTSRGGEQLPATCQKGRGDSLWILSDTEVYRLSVLDCLRSHFSAS